ncbi:MAG: superoxide dismutase [Ni] [Acidobacteriota bacterium]
MKKSVLAGVVLAAASVASVPAGAHCQVPCGIYDDLLRARLLAEHITTIERSIKGIQELAGKTAPVDVNQLVRWIENKDTHADLIAELASEYFLRQRIKAPAGDDPASAKKFADQLAALHGLLVTSMKAKQTVDSAIPGQLRELLARFDALYFSPEDLRYLEEHR